MRAEKPYFQEKMAFLGGRKVLEEKKKKK